MSDAEWEHAIAEQDAQRAAEKAECKAEARRRLLSVTPSAARMQALRPAPPPEPDEERKPWTAADAFSIVGEKQRKKAAAAPRASPGTSQRRLERGLLQDMAALAKKRRRLAHEE
jgi:hypothetical protein